MKRNNLMSLAVLGAAVLAAACSESSAPSLESDAEVTADVAAVSGDAIASDVREMIAGDSAAGPVLPVGPASVFLNPPPPSWNVVRTMVCYDSQNQQQAQCNAQTTASIKFNLTIDGNVQRSNSGPRGTESMTIGVHRARQLTVSGLFGTETSRTHDGFGSSNDTTTFTGTGEQGTLTRVVTSASQDTVSGVVFTLPRSTHPWPTAGQIIRNVSGSVDVTQGERHESRSFARRVTVTFPADAQGNVAITINGTTCTLNLVTHAVANCSTGGGST